MRILLITALVHCSLSLAQETTSKPDTMKPATFSIIQLLLERDRVVIQSNVPIKEGAELIASFSDGKQCLLITTAAKDTIANVDTSKCSHAKELTVGQKLEASLAIEERLPAKPPAETAPTIPTIPPLTPIETETKSTDTPTRDYQRSIVDIQYLPTAGTGTVLVNYDSSESNGSINLATSGNKVDSQKNKSSSLMFAVTYGLLDNLSLTFGVSQVLKSTDDFTYGPGSTNNGTSNKYKSSGWRDPAILLTYRAAEQNVAAANADLTIGYSPKSGDNIDATTIKDGNAKRGGDAVTIGVEVGKKYATTSYALGAAAIFNGKTTSHTKDSSTNTTGDSYTHSVFMVRGQVMASEIVHLRGTIQADYHSDQKFSTPGTSDLIAKAVSQTTLGLDLIVLPAPNFSLDLAVQKSLPVDQDGSSGTTDLRGTEEGSKIAIGATVAF